MPITTHSHPLTPCTDIQLVIASFLVSLLVLEIGPLKHSSELPLQWWHVENICSCNRLTNTALLLLLPVATALTTCENSRGSPLFGVLSWLSWRWKCNFHVGRIGMALWNATQLQPFEQYDSPLTPSRGNSPHHV